MMHSTELNFVKYLFIMTSPCLGGGVEDMHDLMNETLTPPSPVRKCCSEEEFYSVITHTCESSQDILPIFGTNVENHFLSRQNITFNIIAERIMTCPDINSNLYTDSITSNNSHKLLPDGAVYDIIYRHRYETIHYCLEMVGNSAESSNLVLAYCPGERNLIPKCCPSNTYFDSYLNDCYSFDIYNESISNSKIAPFLSEGHILKYQTDLTCVDVPIRINLMETEFEGNSVCVNNIDQCYRIDKYCVDNVIVDQQFEPSTYVCPDFFINKCCPLDSSLRDDGCVKTEQQSLSLTYFLKNYRYQIKGVSDQEEKCTPFTIEDGDRSDIKWDINSYGLAVIVNKGETIHTRNFCIDDFIEGNDIFPVLKVCSEEIKVYHEVSSLDKWPDAVGKCCPLNKLLLSNVTGENDSSCIYLSKNTELAIKDQLNVSNLVFSHFPKCDKDTNYHHYALETSSEYSTILNEDQTLTIKERCRSKTVIIQQNEFCIDLMVVKDGFNPVAIICAPNGNNFHLERNPVIATLVAVSCAALLITLLTLVLMRVRRGMITVKKVNTLAGKTLISYVLSQLIGYFVLCLLTLADFGEGTHTCLILSGCLLYFITASFFWNSSICLECLLLTLQVRISGNRRFFYYCLLSWGFPGILTVLALIKDTQANYCESITPKFGVDRCFFSDPVAQILYFYLPISLTVVLNFIFLITAKILRRVHLKDLAKDPHRIRKHSTIRKAISKNFKRRKESETNKSSHSGLRTHQRTNIWIESVKLVIWSGITWILELAGTLISVFIGRPKGEWYHYLWYLPVACNCLRGIGIFVLIVITTDNKSRFVKTIRNVHTNLSTNASRIFTTVRFKETSKNSDRLRKQTSNGKRKESITTVITNISSSPEDNNYSINNYCHSVSQYNMRGGIADSNDDIDKSNEYNPSSSYLSYSNDIINFNDMYYCTHL